MRSTGLLFAAAAVLSMIAAPAFADPANPAAKLSLTNAGSNAGSDATTAAPGDVRAGSKSKRSSKFIAAPLIILGVVVAGGAVAGAVVASNSDSKPASA